MVLRVSRWYLVHEYLLVVLLSRESEVRNYPAAILVMSPQQSMVCYWSWQRQKLQTMGKMVASQLSYPSLTRGGWPALECIQKQDSWESYYESCSTHDIAYQIQYIDRWGLPLK